MAPACGPRANLPRLREAMVAAGVDALVATTPANVTYVSDVWSLSHWSRRTSLAYAIVATDPLTPTEVVLPASNADLVAAEEVAETPSVSVYGEFVVRAAGDPGGDRAVANRGQTTLPSAEQEAFREALANPERRYADSLAALVAALARVAARGPRVALEVGGLPDGGAEELARAVPGLRSAAAEPILSHARAVKTAREIELLRRAAAITESAVATALTGAREGDSEAAVERRYLRDVVEAGGSPFLTSVTSGVRTSLPNGQATERRIEPGDLIRFDGGCRYRLYASDLARMGVAGRAAERARRIYGALSDGLETAIAAARPGASGHELFHAAVRGVREAGVPGYERSHCGHGIGIENYDRPRIADRSDDVLEPGMVVCLETPYYELGWGGLQAEDMLLVTGDGVERLTRCPALLG